MVKDINISIGQLSQRTGISVSAIRYYETQGLVNSERSSGGQRRFLRSDIRRLSMYGILEWGKVLKYHRRFDAFAGRWGS